MVLLTYFFRNHVRDANRRIRTAIARINGFLQEHISGMSVVQLFNREQKSREQFANFNRIHMEAYKDAIDAFSYFYPGVEFLSMGGIALRLLGRRRGSDCRHGSNRRARVIHEVRATVLPPDSGPQRKIQHPAGCHGRFGAHLPVCWTSPSRFAIPGRALLPLVRGEIEFRNVWFAYSGGANPKEEDWVLRDVSFRVEPGQTLAIVGHTGAGKTTIIQLLLRFYDIQRGQILIDGVDIREMNLQELRRLFGIVLQDPFLFTGTLESNVKLGHLNNRSRRQPRVRCARSASARTSTRSRGASKRPSPSAAARFRSASASSSVSRAPSRTILHC